MDKKRWKNTEAEFDALFDLSESEKKKRLETLREENPQLYKDLKHLLELTENSQNFLEEGRDKYLNSLYKDLASESVLETEEEFMPRKVGRYKLLKPIGRGGMGNVYLAERADGLFERKTAIKFVRTELNNSEVKKRFNREKKIQASLDHPSIARLYDASTDEHGVPFLVMEYVDGQPITTYSDENNLSVRQRVELFISVCQAVQYAHQNLIIHRDLKPSNILVNPEGECKLLDFGIAKLLDQNGDLPELTRSGQQYFSMKYAAPEQIQNGPVNTLTDVYSLGVLLYKLLTGSLPYTITEQTTYGEFERKICDDPVPKPSSVVRKSKDLYRQLKGDMDNIILKALEKSPDRRYRSAEALSDDLKRYLDNLPVSARPVGIVYRSRKFIQRNKKISSFAALLLIIIISGLYYHTTEIRKERDIAKIQRDLAELEAAKTARVSEFVVGLFEQSDPYSSSGKELTVGSLLAQGRDRIETLDEAPLVQAEMYMVLARVYRSLAEHETAHNLSGQALSLLEEQASPDSVSLANAWTMRAYTLSSLGRYNEAEEAHRQALELTSPENKPALAERLNNLGLALFSLGQLDESQELLEEALTLRRAELPESAELAASLNNLALVLAAQDKREEAEPLYRSALEMRRSVLGDEHPTTTYSMTNLATLLDQMNRLEEAEAGYREALRIRRNIFGDDHPAVASVLYQIGWLQSRRGELEQARIHLEEALEIRSRVLGPDHPSTAVILNAAAVVARDMGEVDQAEQWLRRALSIYRSVFGDSHHDIALVLANMGQTMQVKGNSAEAERLLLQALEMNRRELGMEHRHVADNLRNLAELELAEGNKEQAADYASSAREVLDALGLDEEHPDRRVLDDLIKQIQEV
ncbi:tetratricopeptide repeat protein [Rhodohalobacter sp.]|uniref:tetratricopeptide repeat protein n=1 Tax=Rhodohalobacter sp. TaxID=1974210 RepID=UPI002ACD48F4|nr:tetratricopeptide repeat protein [Rhodohalobacter sp.]MDZ7758192.1 tetratricopeptide repeat protein [Rhodohalobacter sp.]